MMKPADNVIICPNCGDGQKIIDVESGELICTKCGFVIHERVGDEQEGWSILGSELNAAMRSTFDRLRAWDFRVKGQDERSLRRAFVELDRLRSIIQLSEAI